MSGKSMSRREVVGTLGAGLVAAAVPAAAAQPGSRAAMQVKKFNVTVHRFDPQNPSHVEEFVLPVDCPDMEHAASAVLSNLIAWTPKLEAGRVLPIAFQCVAVVERAG